MDIPEYVKSALQRIVDGAKASDTEGERLEFKQGTSSKQKDVRSFADVAVCLANASGGALVIGVTDKVGGEDALFGTDHDPEEIRRQIYELTEPQLLVECEELTFAGHRLVVVLVLEALEVYSSAGVVYRRVGASCLKMTPEQTVTLFNERRGKDWSQQIADRSLSDLDPEALLAARRLLRERPGRSEDLAQLDDTDLLRALGVLDEQDRLRRSGSVFFCPRQESQPWVIYQHKPSQGAEADTVERLNGPLLLVFERLIYLITARRVTTPVNLQGGIQLDLEVFPEEAVRESVANALLHQDFDVAQPVSVEHSPELLVVSSPGLLVSGVTEHNLLTTPSKPRNKSLFNAARHLGIGEETGRGFKRMYRELIRAGQDHPVVTQQDWWTRVVFTGGLIRQELVRLIRLLPDELTRDVDVLLVLHTLLHQRTVTAQQLALIIHKEEVEAQQALTKLVGEPPGILEVTPYSARRKTKAFRLRSAAYNALQGSTSYARRRDASQDEVRVVEYVRQYERITNSTLRNMLGVETVTASKTLRALRNKGVLAITSPNTRGRGVEYGPGPNFPGRPLTGSRFQEMLDL